MLLSGQSASDVLLHMELCHRTFHSALPAMDQADVGSHAIRLERHDTTSENSLAVKQFARVCEIGPDGSSPTLAWHADYQFTFARLSINDTVTVSLRLGLFVRNRTFERYTLFVLRRPKD